MNRVVEVFYRIGFLSIPLICAPLLPLVMAKVPTSSPQPVARPIVPVTLPLPKKDTAVASWHRQQVNQSLLAGATEIEGQNTIASWHRQQINQSLLANGTTEEINGKTAPNHPQKATSAKATPQLEMKIAIANTSNLVIATSTAGVVVDETGRPLKTMAAGQGFSAIPNGQKIDFNGNGSWQAPASIWITAQQGGFVYVGQHWYRGKVHLVLQGFSLLAVNHVNLDDYLYSVVGSEMPSQWPLEALKAQAIAARSYALAHYIQPASSLYHMGADQASQVYKGLDGEAGSTHQAVNQTIGEFLSYRGGVVESLYADTDEVVIKAHGGLGMSQTGAMQLANKGYDYLHILGAYYPGTSLAKLQLSKS